MIPAAMPPLYFSLRNVQPFADMTTEQVEGEEGVHVVLADGVIVGLRLADPRMVLRLNELCERLGIEPDRAWGRLRADADAVSPRRASWGTGAGP
ncbi:MAG: hypothetical protein QOK40_2896 [Miltoncostaeaceae bacterium]|jgi:hypothetical protein|nr:hypothetical protein [Miltoncostaeaceae bacterium]